MPSALASRGGLVKPWRLINTLAAVIILLFIIVSSGAERQAPQDKSEQAIRDLEQRWLENEDDPSALATILADDFVHALPMGFIGKQDQLNFLRKHHQISKSTKHFGELRVRLYGSIAIANGIVVETQEGAAAVRKTVFTDVFVRRHGTWQAVNAQETPWELRNSN
jgi:hypothetical protein